MINILQLRVKSEQEKTPTGVCVVILGDDDAWVKTRHADNIDPHIPHCDTDNKEKKKRNVFERL